MQREPDPSPRDAVGAGASRAVRPTRRPAGLMRVLAIILAAIALAVAGGVGNHVLLGYADRHDDPIGKLVPRADLTAPAEPAPAAHGDDDASETEDEELDD